MAKSLRSKSKLRAKSIKRKGEFTKYIDGRNLRLAQKLADHTQKQEEAKADKPEKEEESMELDSKTTEASDKKVSTSGWRDSRTQIYKKVKAKKSKKNKSLKF